MGNWIRSNPMYDSWKKAKDVKEEEPTPQSVKDIQVGGKHYKDMAIQPSEFIVANELGWYEGNAVKYICRHKAKNGKQDLEKAIHYLQLALDHHYKD